MSDIIARGRPPSAKRKTRIFSEEGITGDPTERWSALDGEGVGLVNISTALFKMKFITALYFSHNLLETIPSALGLMTSLTILDLSFNRLKFIPPEIGNLVSLNELLLHSNQLKEVPFQLGHLFQLVVLTLADNPLKESMARLAGDGVDSFLAFLLNNTPTLAGPPPRQWIPTPESQDQMSKQILGGFTVVSYNILCDKYTSRSIFGWCANWALKWEYRRQAIIKQINELDCDLVALQEVETSEYFSFFLPQLHARGFQGVFCAKTRAKTMGDVDSNAVDGCALFFRTSKFQQQQDELVIEFSSLSIKNSNRCGDMINRAMPKDNVGIVVVLNVIGSNKPLIVVNTHLTWDPEFKDVKLIQSILLMNEIKLYMDSLGLRYNTPIVICGDFNSLPDSGVYEYITRGQVNPRHRDFEPHNYAQAFASLPLRHPFSFRSTFGDDFTFTNYTYKFKGSIDYIFYSKDLLSCEAILSPISPEVMAYAGCPNPHFPSDHIPIAARMALYSQ